VSAPARTRPGAPDILTNKMPGTTSPGPARADRLCPERPSSQRRSRVPSAGASSGKTSGNEWIPDGGGGRSNAGLDAFGARR